MKKFIFIPARLESTRLPRKLLLADTGKPLIEHTVDSALRLVGLGIVDRVFVVSDSILIPDVGSTLVFLVIDPKIRNGSERIASAIRSTFAPIDDDALIINWQADEPELSVESVKALIAGYLRYPSCDMATLMTKSSKEDNTNQNVVKVGMGTSGFAYCFSRDFYDGAPRHVGIYAYTPRFLKWYGSLPQSGHEIAENLEQMRAISAGCRVRVVEVDHPFHGIDTREQYDAFVAREKARREAAPQVTP